jgi:hypothetical protein
VHLLRQEYGTFQLAASELSTDPGMWSRLKVYGENMNSEMLRVTPILAVLGLVSSLFSSSRSTRRSSLCLFLSFLLYLLVFHKLANLDLRPLFLGVQARFWQQANMYVWIWAGAGVKTVADGVEWIGGRKAATTSGRASSSVQVADSSSSSSSSKASQAKLLLTSLYTVAFIALHFTLHYPIHDHRANDGFYTQGVSMLRSFPKGSIVLLNGDLNNNLVKYPQQCEGVRPDLSLLSLQLMSWDWFVPVQRDNYPAVIFPGIRYHTTTPQSFNIKRFLDANIKSKKSPGGIFLCGPFKDGDNSNIRTRDPNTGATTSKFYEEHPYGLCSQLLPHGAQPKNMTTHLRRGWVGLPRMSSLPPYLAWKYGEETWEHVMYKDNMQRLAYLTSIASFNSNKNMEDVSLLKVAYDFTEEMRRNEALLREFKLMGEYEYRSAGVIYGLWSKHLYSLGKKDEAETAARRIYYSWRQYLLLHPGDPEILPAVENKLNPYSGTPIVGLEGEEEYLRLPELKTKAAPQQQQQPQPAKKQTDAKKQQDPASAKPQPQPKKQQPKKDQPGKK